MIIKDKIYLERICPLFVLRFHAASKVKVQQLRNR